VGQDTTHGAGIDGTKKTPKAIRSSGRKHRVCRQAWRYSSPSPIQTFTVGSGLGSGSAAFTGSAACAVRGLGRHRAYPYRRSGISPRPEGVSAQLLTMPLYSLRAICQAANLRRSPRRMLVAKPARTFTFGLRVRDLKGAQPLPPFGVIVCSHPHQPERAGAIKKSASRSGNSVGRNIRLGAHAKGPPNPKGLP